MPFTEVPLAPGCVTEDHPALAKPRWQYTNNTRFYRGWPQPIGGRKTIAQIAGIPRGMFSWAANDGRTFGAIGTHSKLYVYYRSFAYNVTPIRRTATIAIGNLATQNGSPTATITDTTHGATTGDTAYFKGDVSVGGIQWGGGSGSLSAPFTTQAASNFVTVAHTAHGLHDGGIVTYSGASPVGGITPSGDYTIRVLSANSYEFEHTSPAGVSATGGGTVSYSYHRGWVVTVIDVDTYTVTASSNATAATNAGTFTAEYEINVGRTNGEEILTGATGGYGGGYYGVGGQGALISHQAQYYPRIWTFAPWGQNLDACPFGDTVYEWALNTSTRAAAVSGVPAGGVNTIFVSPYRQLFLVGSSDGTTFDPRRINYSDQEDNTVYTPSPTVLAGVFTLSEGSIAMRGAVTDRGIVIWTDKTAYPVSYQGDPNAPYSLGDPLATNCGLIAPLAMASMGGVSVWIGTNYNFYQYDGSPPEMLPCDVRADVLLNMAPLQEWKIWGGSNKQWNEFWFGWQSQSSANFEVDRYVIYSPTEGWAPGSGDWTSWQDKQELAVVLSGNPNGKVFAQELGTNDDGSPLIATAITYAFEFGAGHPRMDLKGIVPIFSHLAVGVELSVYQYEYPQSTPTIDSTNLRDGSQITIRPGQTTQDLHSSGRLMAVKFQSVADINCFWQPAGFWLDITQSGSR
ncbi:MAG TPA: hypothetical protein VIS06_06400 [Mycobacteriales bacterium]